MRRHLFVAVAAGLAVALLVGLNFYHVPIVVFAPGPIENVLDNVEISPAGHTHDPTGALYLTTVGEWDQPNFYQALLDLANPAVEIYPRDEIYPPGQTTEQVDLQDVTDMSDSQVTATIVALRLLGYKVSSVPVGAAVAGVLDGGPSVGKLQPGDDVLTVDGRKISNIEDVRRAIDARGVDQEVHFFVRRGGKRVNVNVTTVGLPGDPSQPIVGISLENRYDLPFNVTVNTGDIGGPSAGMMITLSIYDKLSPINLTGGDRIAGTGTVALNGDVGQIGGVTQKMIAARRGGVRIFLVDRGDYPEAERTRPAGLEVVPVSTVQGAIHWLETHTAHAGAAAG